MKTENRDNTYVFHNFVRMSKQKLTLALEPDLIAFGKEYAAKRGTSVSELLESYLARLRTEPSTPEGESASALVRRIRQDLAQGQPLADFDVDVKEVRSVHLKAKYA